MSLAKSESYAQRLQQILLAPIKGTSKGYKAFVLFLLVIIAWALYAYVVLLSFGHEATGLSDYVTWGFFISAFIFWVGASLVGAIVSAVLRLAHAGWRTPLTRIGELITVSALPVAALMIMVDVGRPERMIFLITYGRFQSPLIWDVIGLTTYLIGSFIYLYLPAIPDFALIRDQLQNSAVGFKQKLYTLMAAGWNGTPEQRQRLGKAIHIMTVMIIPIGVSLHSVVGFILAGTLRPGWDSSILAPNFVVGAFFAGVSLLLVVMGIFRKFCHLEEYITEKHFRYISYLAIVLLFSYLYFVVVEYLTVMFKMRLEEKELFTLLLLGPVAPWFWTFVVTAFILPAVLMLYQRGPTIPRLIIAGFLVTVGMFIKRFIIVAPSLEVPLMPTGFQFATYTPSWTEVSIIIGGFALFALSLTLATKIMPIMPYVELVEENRERGLHQTEEMIGRT